MGSKLIPVGEFVETYNAKTNQALPCETIYRSKWFFRHVWNRHPEDAENLLASFQSVIDKPDFVGKHPEIPNSIELVKTLDTGQNVLVGIKRRENSEGEYFDVTTAYLIDQGRMNGHLRGGRLHQLP